MYSLKRIALFLIVFISYFAKCEAVFLENSIFESNKSTNDSLVSIVDDVNGLIVVRNLQVSSFSPTGMDKSVKEKNLIQARNLGFFYVAKYLLESESAAKELLIQSGDDEILNYFSSYKILNSESSSTNIYTAVYEISFKKDSIEAVTLSKKSENNVTSDSVTGIINFSTPSEWALIYTRLVKSEIDFEIIKTSKRTVYVKLKYRNINFNEMKVMLNRNGLDIRRTLDRIYIFLV